MRRTFLACCVPLALIASSAWAAGPVASAELPPLPAPSASPAPPPPPASAAPPAAVPTATPGPGSQPAPTPPDVVVLKAPALATHDAPTLDNPAPRQRSFYESGWFWGALGAAALVGGAIYLATQDTSSPTIHLEVQVPH
jgi:hypothetical protein